jgi:hypothetical protein
MDVIWESCVCVDDVDVRGIMVRTRWVTTTRHSATDRTPLFPNRALFSLQSRLFPSRKGHLRSTRLEPSQQVESVTMRITKKQLAGVDKYKYSGVDKSVLSKHVLGPFWTWLVTCFPLTLAPNTVS